MVPALSELGLAGSVVSKIDVLMPYQSKVAGRQIHHPVPQSDGEEPHLPSRLQHLPKTMLQKYMFGPPHEPSVVYPCHSDGESSRRRAKEAQLPD